MTDVLVALALLFALIGLGSPVYIALGISGLAIFLSDGLPPAAAAHTIINGVNSFPLIAIPFFIFAGQIMNAAKITDRIFDFARAIVGWIPGGLGHVNIGSSVIFAGMSGAAVADAGGLGAIEIKAMRDAGYSRGFAVGVTAASSTIGPIVPPSLPLIIYGVMAEVSIGALFAAGILPGLLMAISLMIMVYLLAKRRNYPIDASFDWERLMNASKAAILPLVSPLLIVGGIVSGAFTPTEAAIAAVAYSLFLGSLIYRTLDVATILHVTLETVKTTSAVLLIVASAALFAWVLTANQVAEQFVTLFLGISENQTAVLLMIMLVVFVVGLFMETIAAITILVPLLLPVTNQANIDPVFLGIVLVLNLMLGLLTPPVGMVLYVLAKVADTPFEECVRATMPFIIPLLCVLSLLVLFPSIVLWLPSILYSS